MVQHAEGERLMPIHLPQLQPRLAVAGHIKNGVNEFVVKKGEVQYDEHGQPKLYPKQLDHYLVTTLMKDPQTRNFVVDDEVMKVLPKDQDGKCRRIPILVHSDDFQQFFPMELGARQGKVMACRGDGVKAMRVKVERGQKIGQPFEVACPCSWLDPPLGPGGAMKSDPVCKANATLRCKIALPEAVTIGSVYDYHTTSIIGVPDMLGGFTEIQSMIGTLVWVPLWLVLRAVKVQPEGFQKTVYSSFVHLRGSDVKAIQDRAIGMVKAAREVHQIAGRTTLSLPLPPRPTEDDENDELDEFYEGENGRIAYDPVTGVVYDDANPPPTDKAAKRKTTKSDAAKATVAATATTKEAKPEDTKDEPAKDEPRGERQREGAEHISRDDKTAGSIETKPESSEPQPPPEARTQLAKDTTTSSIGFDEILPADDPLRAKLAELLKELAVLRGFASEKIKDGMKEILVAITTEVIGQPVKFPALKLGHAMKLRPEIERLIQLKRNENEDDEPEPSESAEDDDEIPT